MTHDRNDPPVPPGAAADGWMMTEHGRARPIRWGPVYVGTPDAEGAQDNTVCVTALQTATGRLDMFSIEINVAGSFGCNEAFFLAANIQAAVKQIDQLEEANRQR